MSEISAINNSIYSGLLDLAMSPINTSKASLHAIQPLEKQPQEDQENPLDLGNYYSNLEEEGLLSSAGQNVVQAADALENAMVAAISNGFTVQDACNIKLARAAYNASTTIYKQSTFEVAV